ncbi:MAG TPA: cytochrome c oxidase assembly protein [Stellaceae bacterium]|nr:cytochrome c oxidase assembly protein [Stellaceae bacterium]
MISLCVWQGASYEGGKPEAVAALLPMASMDVWQIPRIHDRTLHDGVLHGFMHAGMLAAGPLFRRRVLDRRPPPVGASRLVRLSACGCSKSSG